jgi:hypothetical protein
VTLTWLHMSPHVKEWNWLLLANLEPQVPHTYDPFGVVNIYVRIYGSLLRREKIKNKKSLLWPPISLHRNSNYETWIDNIHGFTIPKRMRQSPIQRPKLCGVGMLWITCFFEWMDVPAHSYIIIEVLCPILWGVLVLTL